MILSKDAAKPLPAALGAYFVVRTINLQSITVTNEAAVIGYDHVNDSVKAAIFVRCMRNAEKAALDYLQEWCDKRYLQTLRNESAVIGSVYDANFVARLRIGWMPTPSDEDPKTESKREEDFCLINFGFRMHMFYEIFQTGVF